MRKIPPSTRTNVISNVERRQQHARAATHGKDQKWATFVMLSARSVCDASRWDIQYRLILGLLDRKGEFGSGFKGRKKKPPEGGHAVASTSCFFSPSSLFEWIGRGKYLFRVGAALVRPHLEKRNLK